MYNSPASYGPKMCQYDFQNETKIPVFIGGISVIIYMNCSQRKINKRFNVPFIGYVAHSGKTFMEIKFVL